MKRLDEGNDKALYPNWSPALILATRGLNVKILEKANMG